MIEVINKRSEAVACARKARRCLSGGIHRRACEDAVRQKKLLARGVVDNMSEAR